MNSFLHHLDSIRHSAQFREAMDLAIYMLVGGVIVVGFTYLFGLENSLVHTLMVGALATIIALALFSVAELDYPFGTGVQVQPAAFELTLDRLETSRLSDL